MKKLLTSILLFLLGTFQVMAVSDVNKEFSEMEVLKKKNIKSPLVGIWQLYGVRMTGKEWNKGFSVYLKVLSSDGTFRNLTFDGQLFKINRQGVFYVQSDKVYVECIDNTIHDDVLANKENRIEYTFSDNKNELTITYTMPGQPYPWSEKWIRVIP